MSYEIHLSIPEDSRRGHLITSLTAQQHITPAQAVEKIIDLASQEQFGAAHDETPAELVDRLRARKAAGGQRPQPPLRTTNPETVIGLFGDAPELVDSILKVVETRSERYMGSS